MAIDLERFKEVQPLLKEWFPPDVHVERDLPGGQTWWYVPWQIIRDRLDEVVPDWQVDYTDPVYLEELCVIRCRITICGITREAPGNAPIKLLSRTGKDMSRGTPVERAVADAFKSCCESFGICRYLDDQTDKKNKEAFIRYLHKSGNGRAAVVYRNNQAIAAGESPRVATKPSPKPFGGVKDISFDREATQNAIRREIRRIGWDTAIVKAKSAEMFNGKDKLDSFTNEELSQFVDFLLQQPAGLTPALD